MDRPGPCRKHLSLLALGAALAVSAAGCTLRPAEPEGFSLPPVPDRIRTYYSDLRTGRFAIIADFEEPEQVQIFRVEGSGNVQLTVSRSRLATGAGALRVMINDPTAALLVDDTDATDWALPRNWQGYELFMASVYAPRPVVLRVRMISGFEEHRRWTSPPLPMAKGWNLLRLDLQDIARGVDVSDIRQIRFEITSRSWPAEFWLDDLLLADNTKNLFGSPTGLVGSLYVQRRGKRLHVGACGRFELVFREGLLDQWYDLATDPQRRHNLAGSGPLGPMLVPVDQSGKPAGQMPWQAWHRLGRHVRVEQRLVEANSLFVTVASTVTFSEPSGQDSAAQAGRIADRPSRQTVQHRYRYTIRPDGRIYFFAEATVATPQWQPQMLALAVMTAEPAAQPIPIDPLPAGTGQRPAAKQLPQTAASGPASQAASAPAAGRAESAPTRPRSLLIRFKSAQGTALLFAPHEPQRFRRTVNLSKPSEKVSLASFLLPPPADRTLRIAAMLAVWPADIGDASVAAALGQDYQRPSPPIVQVGTLVRTGSGDLDGDGFDESIGCWLMKPDGPVLRVRWPAGRLRFWPLVKVLDTAGRKCWAYLDGKILRPIERAGDGQAVFAIPQILSRTALLEVTVASE